MSSLVLYSAKNIEILRKKNTAFSCRTRLSLVVEGNLMGTYLPNTLTNLCIALVEKRERRENCQYIMFDEERLDPHGVGNLPHVLTANKSSTFGVRGRY